MAIQGLTLGTQRGLTNDLLIKGIIDSVVTVNQFYQMLPFKGIQGNALAYSREEAGFDQQDLVDVLRTGVSGINKDAQKFTRHSTELTTIIGDAQVNGLVQAVGSDYNDATAVQIAAKAKGMGRRYMDLLINGTEGVDALVTGTFNRVAATTSSALGGTSPVIAVADFIVILQDAAKRAGNTAPAMATLTNRKATNGIIVIDGTGHAFPLTAGADLANEVPTASGRDAYNAALRVVFGNLGFDGMAKFITDSSNTVTAVDVDGVGTTAVSGNIALDHLDLIIDRVKDKDGMVDYIMMNSRAVRAYTAALRATSSAGYDDVMEIKMSSGGVMKVQSYRGVPILRNDFINAATLAGQNGGDGGVRAAATDDIYAGTLDDGSFSHGICGLTAIKASGMNVQKLGAREDVDADITRLKWYCGLAHFSELGLVKGGFTYST